MYSLISITNISIGTAGVALSLISLFLIAASRIMSGYTRLHLLWMFTIMTFYYSSIIIAYYALLVQNAALLQWGMFFFSLFSSMLMLVLTSLILFTVGESHRNNPFIISGFLLWIGYVGMLISTFFFPVFYNIDDEAVYTRGPWYPILLCPPILIMLLNLFGMWPRRKKLNRNQIWAYQTFILVPLFSMLIQLFFPGISAIALGIMIGAATMFYFVQKDQEDKFIKMTEENANREFDIRILQIRPHFIYNVMSSIYYIIGEDPAKAQEVTRDFSIYLKRIFRSISSQKPVAFSEELEHTRAYLAVEMARFADQLNVTYDTAYVDFELPPLILQPVVENAVKHGMDPEIDRLNITIRTRRSDGWNEIIVINDGEDFVLPLNFDEGIGLANIRDRLKRMCGGQLLVSEREGGGTVVTIRIPDAGHVLG